MQKLKKIVKYITVLVCFLAVTSNCFAETLSKSEKPLWELGLFGGIARIPHYPGSDEYSLYAVPLPYFIYRGKFIQSDREGVKGIFIRTRHIETSISLSGNPPVSDDNEAREGMPDLDAILEVGPALKWFFKGRDSPDTLYLKIALRGASSISFDSGMDFAYQGLHGGVNLIYNNTRLFARNELSFGFNAGIDFSDSDLNSYFYDVPEQYTRPDRSFYESDAGYAGFSVSASMQKKITRTISIGSYCRWNNISGTVFEDSPLVKQKNNFVIGCALIWKIAESKRSVSGQFFVSD